MSSAATGLQPQPTASGSRDRQVLPGRQKLVFSLLLFAATLAFYNSITRDGFVLLDDVPYILANPPVRAGLSWATVKWSFTTFHAGYWHPLTWLSHALDCQFFGLNPAGHHYVSLLFHAANAVLLFLLFEEATSLLWPSLLVAALFALHPIQVESVAWAAERKNVLSMFFFLAAMLAYGRYAKRGGAGRYLLVTALFILGLMAKPQIITLPCVLLLWDYWPLRRMFSGVGGTDPSSPNDSTIGTKCEPRSLGFLLWEKVPLFLLVAGASVLTVKAQQFADAVRTLGEFSLKARWENAVFSYARYLAYLVWPRHLAPLYPHPGDTLPVWQVGVSALVLVGLTTAVLYWRERRYLAVGWFWFLGVLVPMIGLVQVGEQAMADRFVYIPMIGVVLALVWAAWEITEEKGIAKAWIGVPALSLALVFGALTQHQLGYWKDGETLWRYTLTVTQRNYMAHDNLAMVLDKQGRFEEAIPEFKAAESLHLYPASQVLSMGLYLQRHGHPQEAIGMYRKVLSRSSDSIVQATVWSQIGAANAQLKNYDEASRSYQNALKLNSKDAGALVGSGLLAERNGDAARAAQFLAGAIESERSEQGYLLLADALRQAGRVDDAEAAEGQAKRLSTDLVQARRNASEAERFFGCPESNLASVSR